LEAIAFDSCLMVFLAFIFIKDPQKKIFLDAFPKNSRSSSFKFLLMADTL